jgi:hypothetical protein
MPFAKVIETPKFGPGALKKLLKLDCVVLRTADKMRGRAGRIIDRKINDTEMIRADLLTHKDAADLACPAASQMLAKSGALIIWQAYRYH